MASSRTPRPVRTLRWMRAIGHLGNAWLILRFGVKRLYGMGGAGVGGNGLLRVLARLPLEPRRTVYIVEAAGKTLLVGASEAGPLTVLAELDERAVAAAVAAAPRQRSFLEILQAKREKRT